MKDNALRTLIIAVITAIVLILFMQYVILPGLIRAMDQLTGQRCQAAFEATGQISARCAEFIGR